MAFMMAMAAWTSRVVKAGCTTFLDDSDFNITKRHLLSGNIVYKNNQYTKMAYHYNKNAKSDIAKKYTYQKSEDGMGFVVYCYTRLNGGIFMSKYSEKMVVNMLKVFFMFLFSIIFSTSVVTLGAEKTDLQERNISSKSNEPFYIYSTNDEITTKINSYFKKYDPEAYKRIVCIELPVTNGYYQNQIDELLCNPDAKDYPDMIAIEPNYCQDYLSTDNTLNISELGIKKSDLRNMYQYTIDLGKDRRNGEIKALTWQIVPNVMCYKRSLAKKYLGTDNPKQVQKYFSDWTTFLKTARMIKNKSNGKTKVISGVDDLFNAYRWSKKSDWIQNGKLVIENSDKEYMNYIKILKDENLTNNTTMWSSAWGKNITSDNTFAYMGCTWFANFVLKDYYSQYSSETDGHGDWGLCEGPKNYSWGGRWYAATKHCSDKELSGKILKFLCCNESTMKKIEVDYVDIVNNKAVNRELAKTKFALFDNYFGGQNAIAIYDSSARKIKETGKTETDDKIFELFSKYLYEYAKGKCSLNKALSDFRLDVKNKLY